MVSSLNSKRKKIEALNRSNAVLIRFWLTSFRESYDDVALIVSTAREIED